MRINVYPSLLFITYQGEKTQAIQKSYTTAKISETCTGASPFWRTIRLAILNAAFKIPYLLHAETKHMVI